MKREKTVEINTWGGAVRVSNRGGGENYEFSTRPG